MARAHHPWSRGKGYPVDERGFPAETDAAYERFEFFLGLGPERSQLAVAEHFGLSRGRTSQLAKTYAWHERAKAYDQALAFRDLEQAAANRYGTPPPPTVEVPVPEPPAETPEPVEPDQSTALALRNLEHERELEEYRQATEDLGRRQFTIAKAMTGILGRSVQQMVEERRVLQPREMASFVAASLSLAAQGQQNWGRAIGVERLLMQMEAAAVEFEHRMKAAEASGDVEVEVL